MSVKVKEILKGITEAGRKYYSTGDKVYSEKLENYLNKLPVEIRDFVRYISPYNIYFLEENNQGTLLFFRYFLSNTDSRYSYCFVKNLIAVKKQYDIAKNLLFINKEKINHCLKLAFKEWFKKGIEIKFSIKEKEKENLICITVSCDGREQEFEISRKDYEYIEIGSGPSVQSYLLTIQLYLFALSLKKGISPFVLKTYLSAFEPKNSLQKSLEANIKIPEDLASLNSVSQELFIETVLTLSSNVEKYKEILKLSENELKSFDLRANLKVHYSKLEAYRGEIEKILLKNELNKLDAFLLALYILSSPPKDRLYSAILRTFVFYVLENKNIQFKNKLELLESLKRELSKELLNLRGLFSRSLPIFKGFAGVQPLKLDIDVERRKKKQAKLTQSFFKIKIAPIIS